MFFDADTHVDETDDTWRYLTEGDLALAPRTLEFGPDEIPYQLSSDRSSGSGYHRFWFVDGALYPRRYRSDERTGTTVGTRELLDVAARIAAMDAAEVDVHVIYPTFLLREFSQRPQHVAALYRSYNRWLAERCAESNGRLRWVAMIPYAVPEVAEAEARFAAANGAAGLFKRGVECGDLAASDPLFHPIYALAAELDLPICIHNGQAWRHVTTPMSVYPTAPSYPVISAFEAMLTDGIPGKFPETKFGFIEGGLSWLPFILGLLHEKRSLEELNFFITAEVDDDLPYLIETAGGDTNLLLGTDYSHGDRASVFDKHRRVASRTDIPASSVERITSENAQRFYRL
jgi:uncharacterized protein